MPFNYRATIPGREIGLIILILIVTTILAVVAFTLADKVSIRLGLLFVVGVFTGGAWLRARRLLRLGQHKLHLDGDTICWSDGRVSRSLPWHEVRRLMIIRGERIFLHIILRIGETVKVPPDCLPETPEAMCAFLKTEVLLHNPDITASIDEEPLLAQAGT